MKPYCSIYIPYIPGQPTRWHPSDALARAITRGAFDSEAEARAWAADHLGECGYAIVWLSCYAAVLSATRPHVALELLS